LRVGLLSIGEARLCSIFLRVWIALNKQTVHNITGKNVFFTATKLGTTNKFLLLQPKILLQQPKVLLLELNILLLRQNIFVVPIFTNDFIGITKPFIPCGAENV